MGMPKEQVKIKMKADGVDPSKLDGGAGEAATHISKASLPKPAPPKGEGQIGMSAISHGASGQIIESCWCLMLLCS